MGPGVWGPDDGPALVCAGDSTVAQTDKLGNRVAGRKPNAVVQDFTVLDQDPGDSVLAFLDMVGNDHAPVPTENQYEAAIKAPNFEQMETRVEAIRRAEQAFLRRSLFPGDTAAGSTPSVSWSLPTSNGGPSAPTMRSAITPTL